MTDLLLSQRRFYPDDQIQFAALSGDANPMHMDPIAARRTQAGAQVVHGLHMLLWGLDALAASHPRLPPIASLKVRFDKMVYLGDDVAAVLTHLDDTGFRLELRVNDAPTSQFVASFETAKAAGPTFSDSSQPILPTAPVELTLEDAAGRSGRVAFAATADRVKDRFPALAALMGADWVRSLLATTTLVGMTCPGLHSIFGGLTVSADSAESGDEALSFRVTKTHPKFRVVRMDVSGPGLVGTIESFVRHPPSAQPTIADLAQFVGSDEFAGSTALVVGGSRGLGELTAKLLCAGGARVIGTYAVGVSEAVALGDEIRQWGGKFDSLHYDVTKPSRPQLAGLPATPTHLFYFATPGIFRSKSELFVAERFAEFRTFYVDAFYELFIVLRGLNDNRLTAFYPSSIAVDERPADMTEYTMAKAAGEILCADIQSFIPGARIVINRLPRLPTDQTATLLPTESADPVGVMLPIIREIYRS